MLETIIIIIALLIAAVLIYAAARPAAFRMERSATINAPAEKIFPFINDFHKWAAWSPWEKLDPALQRSYAGPDSGRGAVYEYEGNNKVGAGRMEITDSTPASRVLTTLDFIRPMQAHNFAEFTLVPQGSATVVTWAMYGRSPYIAKLMTIFVSMDKLVGKQFDEGLANLKAVAEK
ncbi:MAG: polyketide cyclase [Hyphomicrobiales bacterium]|nr:polyketide cyclase [Hyphomicrobiales bacterium]